MPELLKKFNKMVILNESKYTVIQIYNYFISLLNEEERVFCSDNFILFVKSGEITANSNPLIKKKIMTQL